MMEKIVKFLPDEESTIAFGEEFAASLKKGQIVKLTGALGAGKTTFVRGIVSGLGGNSSEVHSPTFSLVHEYECSGQVVKHCDFYRLPEGSELEDLGGLEFFLDPEIYLIEWPERVHLPLPKERIITIIFSEEGFGRQVIVSQN